MFQLRLQAWAPIPPSVASKDMARVAQSHAAVARSIQREQPMHVWARSIAAQHG